MLRMSEQFSWSFVTACEHVKAGNELVSRLWRSLCTLDAFLAGRTVSLFLNESTAVVFSAVTDSLVCGC